MNQPTLIKLERNDNPRNPEVRRYIVKYNSKTIGTVERWESYIWSVRPNWDGNGVNLISDSNTRKGAVARLVEAYEGRRG